MLIPPKTTIVALACAVFAAVSLTAYPVLAHPGNTAADGCHYCRTNCDKWGVAWDERHCHNAKSVPAPLPPVSTPRPVATAAPIVLPTHVSTPIPATPTPTTAPTIVPTTTPEPTIEPVEEEKIEPPSTPEPTVEALLIDEPRKPSAWMRFRTFLGRIFGRN